MNNVIEFIKYLVKRFKKLIKYSLITLQLAYQQIQLYRLQIRCLLSYTFYLLLIWVSLWCLIFLFFAFNNCFKMHSSITPFKLWLKSEYKWIIIISLTNCIIWHQAKHVYQMLLFEYMFFYRSSRAHLNQE